MKVKHLVTGMLALLMGFVLSACAGMSTSGMGDVTCNTGDISSMLKSGEYQQKVDNFLIIQDASSSMSDRLTEHFIPYEPTKLEISKNLLTCLNNSLPEDYDANAGLRIFGPVSADQGLIYGMTKYSKTELENGIQTITGTGGVTPLANAIDHGAYDLRDMPGDAAVIIFSDGINTEAADPVVSTAALKDYYGENVCIYTVQVDNNSKGKMLLEQVAETGKCGFATKADSLMARTLSDGSTVGTADGMADFVKSVFLEKAPPKPAPKPVAAPPPPVKVDLDSDGDGVLDSIDECPNTPKGIKVDKVGCPVAIPEKVSITLLVEFDFDKTVVKPQYNNDLEKVANFLKAYPKTDVTLDGYTDSVGTEEYNQGLSKRRAESVKKYLVEKFGVDAARLSAVGHGESNPVATNETKEGRQRNRRVVTNIVTVIMK